MYHNAIHYFPRQNLPQQSHLLLLKYSLIIGAILCKPIIIGAPLFKE